MRTGVEKVTRRYWYATGGFAGRWHFRRHNGRNWEYFIDLRR